MLSENRLKPWGGRGGAAALTIATCLLGAALALAAPPQHGVLVHLNAGAVTNFQTNHAVKCAQLNSNRDLYLCTTTDSRTDQNLLAEFQTDPNAGSPQLNAVMTLNDDQSTASVLNGDQSTASVLNQSTASVLNQSTASVLNQLGWVNYYGSPAPQKYLNQTAVAQIKAGSDAHALATGEGVVVAEIDNGVDPFNPVLRRSILWGQGYNFYDNSRNWSAYADLAQSTASVLNDDQSTASVLNDDQSTASVLNDDQSTASVLNDDQSTASVLNQSTASVLNINGVACYVPGSGSHNGLDQSTASVLNQSTASVLNDNQSTASVLNGDQSTASVLNGDQSTASVLNQSTASVLNQSTASVLNQSTASVLNAIEKILICNPDFGHGTSVAGLIHLVAPQAKILPIKAFGPDGTATAAVIYEAITYAIDHHAKVINASFSSDSTTPAIQSAIAEAISDGIIVSVAAGNNGTASVRYPATLPGVIGVGAADGTKTGFPWATFSSYGPNADVAAPGVQLFTTYPGFGLIWATVSGTSFTAPLVSGEAALLVQLHQTGAAARQDIENSTDTSILGYTGGYFEHGLIQVLDALQLAPPGSATSSHGDGNGWGWGH